MSDQLKERCAECRFFFTDENKGTYCRRYPPTTMLMMAAPAIALHANQSPQQQPVSVLCPANRLAWCGEYQRKMEGTA